VGQRPAEGGAGERRVGEQGWSSGERHEGPRLGGRPGAGPPDCPADGGQTTFSASRAATCTGSHTPLNGGA
jgi:hypothetical protein